MVLIKRAKYCFFLILIIAVTLGLSCPQVTAQQRDCGTVIQALKSASLITPGTKRSEVEKMFEQDGGISFREETVYVYRQCAMLKIRITFVAASKANEKGDRSQDTVSKVSEMFVDWPSKD